MIFNYSCINKEGEHIEGQIEANSLDNAVLDLQDRELVIVSIREKKTFGILNNFNFFSNKKVDEKDLVIFSRQIATLFEAGIGALKGFRLLAVENNNKIFQKQLITIADDIQTGISISESLSRHPESFSHFYINMVKAGEESGKLNESFSYLADYLERSYELTQKVKKALIYPIFVMVTFVLIMVVMFIFVIPKIAVMFADENIDLPMVTKIILGISNIFVNYGIYVIPVLFIGLWYIFRLSQTEEGIETIDRIKIKIPVLKVLYLRVFLSRFSDNMNTMLVSGVSIIRSLEITAEVVDNIVYKELLLRVSRKVEKGVELSKALYDEPLIPNILVQMVRVGEETGELGYILKNLSNFYKREVDNALDGVVGLIEPAMIVGLGLMVGVLVSAILLPMYNLSASIS